MKKTPEQNTPLKLRSQNDKISTHQLLMMYVGILLTPATRALPIAAAKYGRYAGWVAPIFFAVLIFGLIFVLSKAANGFLAKKKEMLESQPSGSSSGAVSESGSGSDNPGGDDDDGACLALMMNEVFGVPISKILMVFFLAWALLLLAYYTRLTTDRLQTTIFLNSDIRFFLLFMSAMNYFVWRGRLEALARFAEVIMLLFVGVMIMFVTLMVPSVKLSNVLPVTYKDIPNIASVVFRITAPMGTITLLMFLGGHIKTAEKMTKQGAKASLFLGLMITAILFVTIGSLGYRLTQRMPLPFFGALKLVNFLDPFDRLAPIIISIWIFADFLLCIALGFVIMNLLRRISGAKDSRPFAAPVALWTYVSGIFISKTQYETESFAGSILACLVSLVLFFIVPVALLAIGKARKKL
jgi:spore germination protein KB